jgi:ADP-heptose:LPS heptosyltransferase
MLPWLDDTMVCRPPWQDASGSMGLDPEGLLAISRELADRRFDAAFIFTSFSQSPWPPAYACYLAGIPFRAGESKEFGGSLVSVAAPPLPDAAHQVDRNVHLLRACGIPADDTRLGLDVPPEAQAAIADRLRTHGVSADEPVLVVAPGASCAARRYPAERFGLAAALISHAHDLRVVTVGSAREGGICGSIAASIPGAVNMAGETSVPELAALIARAELLLANDSGPMHIADAVGTRMVIAFSGTELESQWEPRTSPARLLRRPTDCAPCHRFECPYGLPCLDIAPAEFAEAACSFLTAPRSREGAVA